jgi:metal-responsive CopG/Arc/MetJ family transcriptional regulator
MKKPEQKKVAPGRIRKERVVISLGLPPSLLDAVDAIAIEEQRSRAQMIAIMLTREVQARRGKAA